MISDNTTTLIDTFEVNHPNLAQRFTFSSSGQLDTIAATIRTNGLETYEAPTTNIIIELVKSSSGLVLDVGANTGLFTLVATAANPLIRACAFEPLENIRELLKANIALNPELAPRIAIEPVGLSNGRGTFSFYETINNLGFVTTSSSLEKAHAERIGDLYIERTIETRTLDEFGETLGNVSVPFIKIDVERHEHAVITGGRRFIAKHRPFLTLEVLIEADTSSLNQLLIQSNYLALAMASSELRQCERLRFHSDAWNHLLVPAEKAERLFSLCRRLGLQIKIC
ncbi:FkbM family methyltransferase [Gluconacetobacter azotocaptans]|uniref:FkbM family methyltransferase n=1 Tax=Gluconacetobacter azotocaptans TaxID=142834 RepID=UPI0019575DE2|nr:FkbM family methyltransferase [Gluconacetobacter azotocaptans]MBM9400468.1 FkbM family methyltransferase [Gluconacetobacter azotocaptans]